VAAPWLARIDVGVTDVKEEALPLPPPRWPSLFGPRPSAPNGRVEASTGIGRDYPTPKAVQSSGVRPQAVSFATLVARGAELDDSLLRRRRLGDLQGPWIVRLRVFVSWLTSGAAAGSRP
jgi:hypothetical protein